MNDECDYDDCHEPIYGTTPDGQLELCEDCLIDTEFMRTCDECGEFGALVGMGRVNAYYTCQNCHSTWT